MIAASESQAFDESRWRVPGPLARPWLLAGALLAAVATAGCGDDHHGSAKTDPGFIRETHDDDGGLNDDGGEGDAVCLGERKGTPCGPDRHCIDDLCVHNTCGDGVTAGAEECDDGNEAVDDGCDPACEKMSPECGNARRDGDEECDDGNWFDKDGCSNACRINECGNERVDQAEECDDGNTVDDDTCSNECRTVKCRNGRLDPGEECDDGNLIPDDGCTNACESAVCGDGVLKRPPEECDDGNEVDDDDCSNRCTINECGNGVVDPGEECDGSAVGVTCVECRIDANDRCLPCERANCTDYLMLGVDVVAGCFDKIDPIEGALEADPDFIQQCIDMVNCARAHGCAYDPVGQAEGCYCGAIDPTECQRNGPAADAACVQEWLAGTRAVSNEMAFDRFTSLALPAGWAKLLLECDRELCREECVPASAAVPATPAP